MLYAITVNPFDFIQIQSPIVEYYDIIIIL